MFQDCKLPASTRIIFWTLCAIFFCVIQEISGYNADSSFGRNCGMNILIFFPIYIPLWIFGNIPWEAFYSSDIH